MFCQLSGHPLIQSSWHVKLTYTSAYTGSLAFWCQRIPPGLMNGWLWLFSFWSIIYTWFLLCCRLLSLLCAFVKMPRKSWHFGQRPCSASIYFMYVSKPCYFLTQSQGLSLWTCVWSESCSVVSDSLWPHGLYSSWNSLGQNTRVGSLSQIGRASCRERV